MYNGYVFTDENRKKIMACFDIKHNSIWDLVM